MRRRTLLKIAALSGVAIRSGFPLQAMASRPEAATLPIHTVLLVTKCHLDVGFSMTQAKVIRKYFDVYFPEAIQIASELRTRGADRYTWTTGSWLLYEYLEQASPAQRKVMEQAIAAGDIDWHAIPFNWQTEMIDRSMLEGSLSFSTSLDRRFGHKTIGAKMTDVPGHSRGIIAPLSAAGVRLLDVGVNPASTPPNVPDVFLWKNPAGDSLAMLYHRHDYGSIVEIPGSGFAVDVEVRGDNSGPHTQKEIAAIYAKLHARYPAAKIKASNMSEVAAAVDRVRDELPVITAEIGDTWIYGCSSDPYKVSRYRELARLRKQWIMGGSLESGDATDQKLLQHLLLAPEHTWGTDTKTYLDDDHYRPADLVKVLQEPGYEVMEFSWKEKRVDIDDALDTLPQALRSECADRFARLAAVLPSVEGMPSHDPSIPIETEHFTLSFDRATGAIIGLRSHATGREWASPQHPLALFTYQSLSADDYANFLARYVTSKADWAPKDFGKPGIGQFGAISGAWHPEVVACWSAKKTSGHHIVLELAIREETVKATGNVAWPEQMFLEIVEAQKQPCLDLTFFTFKKIENRMPEAMWLTFKPKDAQPDGWTLQKVDQAISPLEVIAGGSRSMHAVTDSVCYRDHAGMELQLQTLDAPVVAIGERSPLNFSFQQPDIHAGFHFSLFNNAWGTNYPQWRRGDWAFRFQIYA